MRIALLLLSLFVCVGFLAPRVDAAAPAGPGTVIRGKISKTNNGLETLLLDTKSGKQVTVRTHAKTKFFVDGAAATFDDLDVGQRARVRGRFAKDSSGDVFFRARAVRAKTPPQ